MAIYKQNIVDIDLGRGQIHRSFLNHSIGMYDQQADRFGIRVFRDGEEADLTGVTVQGVFMPPQGAPIAITGDDYTSVEGNTAEVILPQACYNYEGNFTLAIKLVDATNAITGTMRIVDGVVDNTHANGTVAPTGSVPTYQEVLAVYADMVTALVTVDELEDEVSGLETAIDVVPTLSNAYATSVAATSTNPVDMNDMKTPGNYKFTALSVMNYVSNYPRKASGRLFVYNTSGNNYICQLYIANVTAGYEYYIRSKNGTNNDWTDWFYINNPIVIEALAEEGDAWN